MEVGQLVFMCCGQSKKWYQVLITAKTPEEINALREDEIHINLSKDRFFDFYQQGFVDVRPM